MLRNNKANQSVMMTEGPVMKIIRFSAVIMLALYLWAISIYLSGLFYLFICLINYLMN